MSVMREAAQLQESYQALVDEKRLSKRAMCSLCIPFRDKYGLTDLQTLRIARKEMELSEMVDLLEGDGDGEVPTFTDIETLRTENERLRTELKKAEMELDSLLAEGETVAFDPFGAEKEG